MFVTVTRSRPVVGDWSFTDTPGSTAPLGSEIVPCNVAVLV